MYIISIVQKRAHARTHARTHARAHTHAQKKCKSDRVTSTWCILDNDNAGGTVALKLYNSKSI